jgi:hypothetical protein
LKNWGGLPPPAPSTAQEAAATPLPPTPVAGDRPTTPLAGADNARPSTPSRPTTPTGGGSFDRPATPTGTSGSGGFFERGIFAVMAARSPVAKSAEDEALEKELAALPPELREARLEEIRKAKKAREVR